MNKSKKIIKYFLYVLIIPVFYLVVSLILTFITIDRKGHNETLDKAIYLNTNGIHLDIIIPKKNIDSLLLKGINTGTDDQYLSFGWGDKDFYLNTPTWNDLTFKTAFKALFLNSETLLHITRFQNRHKEWKEIKISDSELQKLNNYILLSFKTNEDGYKQILKSKGYSFNDDFYQAKGSYSIFKTCNTWVNAGFKDSGLKACLWTPFDFGLLNKYE